MTTKGEIEVTRGWLREPTEAEYCAPFIGLFAGGLFIAAAILNWVPEHAVNSAFVFGFFLESFSGLWLMLLPKAVTLTIAR